MTGRSGQRSTRSARSGSTMRAICTLSRSTGRSTGLLGQAANDGVDPDSPTHDRASGPRVRARRHGRGGGRVRRGGQRDERRPRGTAQHRRGPDRRPDARNPERAACDALHPPSDRRARNGVQRLRGHDPRLLPVTIVPPHRPVRPQPRRHVEPARLPEPPAQARTSFPSGSSAPATAPRTSASSRTAGTDRSPLPLSRRAGTTGTR